MKRIVFDIETDGLNNPSVIYVLSYAVVDENGNILSKNSLTTYNDMKTFVETWKDNIVIGHNIINYDIPVLERMLNIKIKTALTVDTLTMSWYLYAGTAMTRFGLDYFGKKYGIEKIKVDDWKNESLELYKKRCERDVEITAKLYGDIMAVMHKLYTTPEDVKRALKYIAFKTEMIKINETSSAYLNVIDATKYWAMLSYDVNTIREAVKNSMPRTKVVKKKPAKMYKKDGTLTKNGENWMALLKELGYPEDTDVIYEEPNPDSHVQLKNWLFELGWKPDVFKDGANGPVPQVTKIDSHELTDSVLKLAETHKEIKLLENYNTKKHRRDIFAAFLEKEKDFKISMRIGGFAKTLRVRHRKPIVNLPKVGVYMGKEIRSVLVAGKGNVMIGADLKGLEDRTKQHYIYPYDKEYVEDMQRPDFDPHLDIAVLANFITKDDLDFYLLVEAKKERSEPLSDEEVVRYRKIKKMRSKAKKVNFAATYLAGPATIAKNMDAPFEEGERMYKIYWQRNWAIKKVTETFATKTIGNNMYILNPVSKIWLPITDEKDKFSAVNQSTGVYVFDVLASIFINLYRKEYNETPNIWLQYHDEMAIIVKEERKDRVIELLKEAEKKANKFLKLNVYIPIDIQVGYSYADVH